MPKLITTQTRIEDLGKPRVVIFGAGANTLGVSKRRVTSKIQTIVLRTLQRLLWNVAPSGSKTTSIASLFCGDVSPLKDFFRITAGTGTHADSFSTRTAVRDAEVFTEATRPGNEPPLRCFQYKGAMFNTGWKKGVLNAKPSCFRRCFAWIAESLQLLHGRPRSGNKISLSIHSSLTLALTKTTGLLPPVQKMACTNNG